MISLNHPLLKLDFRTRFRDRSRYVGLVLVYTILLLSIVSALWWNSQSAGADEARIGRRIFTAVSMAGAFVALLVPPFFTIDAVTSEKRGDTLPGLFMGTWKSTTWVLSKITLPAVMTLGLIGMSLVILCGSMFALGGFTVTQLAASHFLLFLFSLTVLLLGFLCSASFADIHVAVGVVFLTILLGIGSPVLAGPLIANLSNADLLIETALLACPLFGLSSAIEFDIMRTEMLYRMSPIGQRRFIYPSWVEISSFYLLICTALFSASVLRVHHLRRRLDTLAGVA